MAIPGIDELTGMSVQDAALWRGARALAELGEVTARWLEGTVGSVPGTMPGYGPDEETGPLAQALARARIVVTVDNGRESTWAATPGQARESGTATGTAAARPRPRPRAGPGR